MSQRRSSGKKRSNASSTSKGRGRSKSNTEVAIALEEGNPSHSSLSPSTNPPPYQFSSPPESDNKKRRPPRMDTSIERNVATTTTNLTFGSDDDGSVSKLGVSVDLTRGDLRPLKSPVRLIGSPSVLNAAIQPRSPTVLNGMMAMHPHSPESPLFSAKGFGRDKERRKKGFIADIVDFNANIETPQGIKRSMSLESTNNENAHLLSLLQRSTTAAPVHALDAISAGIIEPERARTSMGLAGPFEQSNKMIFNSDEGSLDDGSSMYNSSMEFEAVNAAPGGGMIIAPLSNAPLTGFKHKGGGGSSDKGGGGGSIRKGSNSSSKDNTNTNSPRGYNDSSMENSVDSMEGHAVAALERVNLNVKEKKGRGFLDDRSSMHSRRPTLDAEEEARLSKYASPLLAHKSSSRHIPPLAPPIKNVGGAGEAAVETENKGVVLTGHTGSVNHLAKLGSRGDLELLDFVVSAGSDSTVRVWNVAKGLCAGRCTDLGGGGADQGAISALATVRGGGGG